MKKNPRGNMKQHLMGLSFQVGFIIAGLQAGVFRK
jgi:hypothetical protein